MMSDNVSDIVFGRNSVRELLRSGREIDKIFIKRGEQQGSVRELIYEARQRKIPIVEVSSAKLDLMTGTDTHQGVAAYAVDKEYCGISDILDIAKQRGETPLIVICDGIEDPQNLGAVIRVADGCGAHGVIIPKRRSSCITGVVEKASAGALEHMAIAKVQNLVRAVEELKENGVWTYAAEAGGTLYSECDFDSPTAIVLGSEGNGVSRLLKETCDFTVSIPMYGKVNSLNVATAAAVILYDAAGKLRKKQGIN